MIYFFDTETTGLPTNYDDPRQPNMPRVIQYAGIMTDDSGRTVRSFSAIAKPAENIPESASKIHGITTELANEVGIPLHVIIHQHVSSLGDCKLQVGHNISFDQLMIASEVHRMQYTYPQSISNPPSFCTMKSSTNLVKIPGGLRGYKWPKLQELHKFLFGCEFQGAHDALDDVMATAKCYFELKKRGI